MFQYMFFCDTAHELFIMLLLSSADFFQSFLFQKIILGRLSECQAVLIQIFWSRSGFKLRLSADDKVTASKERVKLYPYHNWALLRENPSTVFPTKRDSNQPAQLQRLARKLKFCLLQVLM